MNICKVAVLGRGASLKKFARDSYLFDILYMVGTFHKEIKKIGRKHFEDKKIIQLVGRSDLGWKNNVEQGLNIIKVQTMYYAYQLAPKKRGKGLLQRYKKFPIHFLPEYMKDRGLPVLSKEILEKNSGKYTDYKEMSKKLEEKFKSKIKKNQISDRRNRYWPTTGAFAVDMCLMEQQPTDLYLYGIDACYTVSFARYKWEDAKYDWATRKKNRPFNVKEKLIIYYISELVREFPQVQFYSASNVMNFDYSNWHLI